ncbi:MAG: hypothetical protein ACYDH6_20570 [Acidimicrobiales bacterium]
MHWREERGGASAVQIVIGTLVALVVVLVIANLIVRPGSGGGTAANRQQFTVTAGPEAGTDLASYVRTRRAAVAQLGAPGWAVVSFDRYTTVALVRRLAGSMKVGALLVATPGGFPDTIAPSDGAVKNWVAATRGQAASDAKGLRQMLSTAGDPQTVAEFRADLVRLAVVAKVDASAPIVFGAVIYAAPDLLRQLQGATGVRLIDPVGATLPDLSGIAGVRPEETGQARTPPTRPTA